MAIQDLTNLAFPTSTQSVPNPSTQELIEAQKRDGLVTFALDLTLAVIDILSVCRFRFWCIRYAK